MMTGTHSGRLWPRDRAWPSHGEMHTLIRTADRLALRGHDWAANDFNVLVRAHGRAHTSSGSGHAKADFRSFEEIMRPQPTLPPFRRPWLVVWEIP